MIENAQICVKMYIKGLAAIVFNVFLVYIEKKLIELCQCTSMS